jgi:diguanylate cyclase (GGDEF)-like protein
MNQNIVRVLRVVTIIAIVSAVLFWLFTVIGWLTTAPGYEPLNVLAAAILSTLVGIFGWLGSFYSRQSKLEKNENSFSELEKSTSKTIIGDNMKAGVVITGGKDITVINTAKIEIEDLINENESQLHKIQENLDRGNTHSIRPTKEELDKEIGTDFVEKKLPVLINKSPKITRGHIAIVMADIDELTIINKQFGNEAGNEVIAIVGGIIKARSAITHHGRCGDDTFYGVVMHGGDKKIVGISEKIRRGVEHYPWQTVAPDLHVTCTLGYASLDPNEDPTDWIRRAIFGMLEGKKKGINTVTSGPMFVGKKYIPKRRQLTPAELEIFYAEKMLRLRDFFT